MVLTMVNPNSPAQALPLDPTPSMVTTSLTSLPPRLNERLLPRDRALNNLRITL